MRVDDYCPHFTGEETKAQRGVLACPRAQLEVGNLDSVPCAGSSMRQGPVCLWRAVSRQQPTTGVEETLSKHLMVDGR